MLPLNLLLLSIQFSSSSSSSSCTTNLNCSLNGVCEDGACKCDAAWRGTACGELNFKPTNKATGDLRIPNVSTWGMTVLPKQPADAEWHGLFAEMSRGCGLTSWETNSLISHAVAPTPDGPWTRKGTALGVWAHTPSAIVARDGTIVLFHLGSGVGGGALPGSREYNASCSAGRSPCGTHPEHHCGPHPQADALALAATTTVSFHIATSPDGPWTKATANITDPRGIEKRAVAAGIVEAENFAFDTPFAHPNGTIYIVTAGKSILRAEDWRGPYEVIATQACGPGEDSYLYVDTRDHFHCLYHRAPFPNLTAQGGHAYSEDGFTWFVGAAAAYPAAIRYSDGTVAHYGKRERPHLIWDPHTGEPTHLTNGVCLNGDWEECNNNPFPGFFDYTFTTVAPLQTSKRHTPRPMEESAASSPIILDVDWKVFLARHDMTWSWEWGEGGVYTIQPLSTALSYCGAQNASGTCCLTAHAPLAVGDESVTLQLCTPGNLAQQWVMERNKSVVNVGNEKCLAIAPKQEEETELLEDPSFSGYVQIALTSSAVRGCSDTAVPPGQCCLPTPNGGGEISGCHAREEPRWHYNQFFAFAPAAAPATFLLSKKSNVTKCTCVDDDATRGTYSYSDAPCNASDTAQQWRVQTTASGGALLENVAAGKCLAAAQDSEAAHVELVDCTATTPPTPLSVWSPLCDVAGTAIAPGWLCTASPPTPSPPGPSPGPKPQSGSAIITTACDTKTTGWGQFEGFWMSVAQQQKKHSNIGAPQVGDGPKPDGRCLEIDGPPFCDGTVCPFASAQNFTAGLTLSDMGCHNGDRSQMFAAYTIPTVTQPRPGQNFIPLTWAVSAYVGNGLVGVRVQSEEGGVGVLRVIIDNVRLGAYGKRKPNGYWRFTVADPDNGAPLHVALRTTIFNSVIRGNVTAPATTRRGPMGRMISDHHGSIVANFTIFVLADLAFPVVVLECDVDSSISSWIPKLTWVKVGTPDFAWKNVTTSSAATGGGTIRRLTAWAAVVSDASMSEAKMNASEIVATASALTTRALLTRTTSWWSGYWSQSFVTLPVTRVESFYYSQMYRFPASDRVTLHGLMGAFGPTSNYNLWSDDVWDMNEQVMYWIGAASNRPEITAPLSRWMEAGASRGNLWMAHNYVKQMRFEGNHTGLVHVALPLITNLVRGIAGENASSHGSLDGPDSNGTFHIIDCSSPEYKCYPPFQNRACSPKVDCNYEISQLRWGISTALAIAKSASASAAATAATEEGGALALALATAFEGIDTAWWKSLIDGALAWYPFDDATGFRLDEDCAFECPHRHFSHLLQMWDLETVQYDAAPAPALEGARTTASSRIAPPPSGEALNAIMRNSLDNWYRVTCNASNWFNEECRGFTQCAMGSMSVVVGRPKGAEGNLTSLIDTVVTPNAMYGEMVFQAHPNEFSPVSESAYCGAGVLHTMLMHTTVGSDGIGKRLSLFPGITWQDAAFHLLRADGGLLVSASRVNGTTLFVRVHSKDERTIVIDLPRDAAYVHTQTFT